MRKYLLLIFSILILYSCSSTKSITTSRKPASNKTSHQRDSTTLASNNLITKYSSLLNVEESKLSNIVLLGFIDSWYSVPYRYGGKTKEGVDCSDFISILLHNVYSIDIAGTSSSLYKSTQTIKKEELTEGDLVFFKIKSKDVSHVGVYITDGYFVHATTHRGVIISSLNEDYYRKYYCCAGRIKK